MYLQLYVMGIPKPKQSARHFVSKTGTIKSYQPKDIITEAENIKYSIQQQLPTDFIPFTNEPLFVSLSFFFPFKKTLTKKEKELIEKDKIYPKTTKPDLDNLQKLVLDAMQGILYTNDATIYQLTSTKNYGSIPMVSIYISTESKEETNVSDRQQ